MLQDTHTHTHTNTQCTSAMSPLYCTDIQDTRGRGVPVFYYAILSCGVAVIRSTNSLYLPSSTQQVRRICVNPEAVVSYGQRLRVQQSYQPYCWFPSREKESRESSRAERHSSTLNTSNMKLNHTLRMHLNYYY